MSIAEDTLEGVEAIAEYIGKTPRQVFHLCQTGQLPVFRLGNKWHLRKSTYAAFIEKLERSAQNEAA